MIPNWMPAIEGFAIGLSMIIPIGAQNAFVLSNGIRRRHRLPIALSCAVSDMLLSGLGVAGAGALISSHPLLGDIARWGGVAFLLWYGLATLKRAWQGESMRLEGDDGRTLGMVLLTTLAVTWLNPHVYLDTVVLLGGLAAQQPDHSRYLFGAGAISASFVWFFSLAYGARLLAPLFTRPAAWRVLDLAVATIMFALAARLVLG